jgi:aconitate hydratase
MPKYEDDLLVKLCAVIHDPVTTTDELIPSGETSSYRSNPIGLSEFALSRRVPEYVERSKAVRQMETSRQAGNIPEEAAEVLAKVGGDIAHTTIGSCVFAHKPGDGSAREQAASCQKVLGGFANICYEFATKRYRSNCINWGIVPFTMDSSREFNYTENDWVYVPGVRQGLLDGKEEFDAKVITSGGVEDIKLYCRGLTEAEKLILTQGCLMNYYAAGYGSK